MNNEQCPICNNSNVLTTENSKKDLFSYECPRCGKFSITMELKRNLQKEQKPISDISSWIREQNEIGKEVDLTTIVYDRLRKDLRIPSVSEKQIKLMKAFENRTKYPGEWIDYEEAFIALGWCQNENELGFLIKSLEERTLIETNWVGEIPKRIRITARGWDLLDEYKRKGTKDSKKAFIAMWFDKSMNNILDNAIYPAVEEAGYEPIRIDRIEHIDKVDDKIIAEIRSSKFLIADLTGHRNGVYFEAGFALGLNIPVIWSVRKDEIDKAHFDVRQFNCIVWESEQDYKEKLLNRIKAVIL